MKDIVRTRHLSVERVLYDFVEHELLPGTGLESDSFWDDFASLLGDFGPRNRELLAVRERLQSEIDSWHAANPGPDFDHARYQDHLRKIGYLLDEPSDFLIETTGVDAEIAVHAGPQLVVPVMNARFALNAVNARWGSLYDALYGTDALPGRPSLNGPYDATRGAQVVRAVREFLDSAAPLGQGSHREAVRYTIENNKFTVTLSDGSTTCLLDEGQFVGHSRGADDASSILLAHHGLHIEIQIDRGRSVGATDPAGVNDVLLESALTTIVDFEDSVVAVDAADKVEGYRNWLGLMRGELVAEVDRDGTSFARAIKPDRTFITREGAPGVLRSRSLLLVRNVGHHMTTDAILESSGSAIPEGILDAVITVLAAVHSFPGQTNSRHGSIYVVKPKMHGAGEVAFTVDLFDRVEQILGLRANTVKLGIMDEERRTSVNLKAALWEARSRVAFVNTGFLDRTADEIHTCREAGPVVPKRHMRDQPWLAAYEDSNVQIGLAAGFAGRAQIGKGMWTMPDRMADMIAQKVTHPLSGASTAWVPSPTAATLHALHYHQVDVDARQREVMARPPMRVDDVLRVPLSDSAEWPQDFKRREVDENAQSILGYVVRWVKQGIGCSKVPDLDGVALMEDRATLRISSQFLANWLRHDVVTTDEVNESLARMASVVDQQNRSDPAYVPMGAQPSQDIAYQAACELVFSGAQQPNGYTEWILHRRRRQFKAASGQLTTHDLHPR